MLNIVMRIPNNFCILPWISLESTAAGWVKPCCMYNINMTDENNQPFNYTWYETWGNQKYEFTVFEDDDFVEGIGTEKKVGRFLSAHRDGV